MKTNVRVLSLAVFFAFFIGVHAQEIQSGRDSSSVAKRKTATSNNSIFSRIIRYFEESNNDKPEKKFDVNFIGGPFYSSDMKFGLGVVGAGLYRMKGCSLDMQPSNVSLFGSVSTVGFYMLGIRGNNLFLEDRYRLNYSMFFYSFPSYYWGIGYDNCNNDINKTKINRFQASVKAEFLFKVTNNLYVGPRLIWDYAKARDVSAQELHLFNGMSLTQRNYGVGASIQYDTRDFITNASKGVYIYLAQTLRPSWLGNDEILSTTEFTMRGYKSVWKGAILATELDSRFNFGDPSWALMAELGGSNSMRGYYEGRYRDKHSITLQVELRQHVWRRNGITIWGGLGNVFHDKRTFRKILPNYGIGYRWEFKKRVNVRLDLGFGKSGQNGFIFNINEAF